MNSKAGFVAVIGKPNAGKSTLINALLEFKLSAVNKKAQTTRNRILGILSEKNYQIIFIDTPGILQPKYELHHFMISEISNALAEADVILIISDVTNPDLETIITFTKKYHELLKEKTVVLVLNKIDLIPKNKLLPLIKNLSEKFTDIQIVPTSALKNENLETIKKIILDNLPESEFYFDRNSLTDKSEKFLASEIIREQILTLYHEEIPYSSLVNITEFKERSEDLVYINADIIIERDSQKAIIIGKKGEGLKRLGEKARIKLQDFLGKKVYLSLFVKIKKDWRKEKNYIRKSFNQ